MLRSRREVAPKLCSFAEPAPFSPRETTNLSMLLLQYSLLSFCASDRLWCAAALAPLAPARSVNHTLISAGVSESRGGWASDAVTIGSCDFSSGHYGGWLDKRACTPVQRVKIFVTSPALFATTCAAGPPRRAARNCQRQRTCPREFTLAAAHGRSAARNTAGKTVPSNSTRSERTKWVSLRHESAQLVISSLASLNRDCCGCNEISFCPVLIGECNLE